MGDSDNRQYKVTKRATRLDGDWRIQRIELDDSELWAEFNVNKKTNQYQLRLEDIK